MFMHRAHWGAAAIGSGYLSVTLLSACYPHQHEYIVRPEISGTLIKSGYPLVGAIVTIGNSSGNHGELCADGQDVAVTNEYGKFHAESRKERKEFSSLLNASTEILQTNLICFTSQKQRVFGGTIISHTDILDSYVLLCDFNSSPVELKQHAVLSADAWGICKSAKN